MALTYHEIRQARIEAEQTIARADEAARQAARLIQGRLRASGIWNTRFSGKVAGACSNGYIRIGILGQRIKAHRLAFLYMTSGIPAVVDHRNHITTDNSWENIRPSNHSLNNANTVLRADNTTGFKGVSWKKERRAFVTQIAEGGRKKHLGYFNCFIEAATEYDKAAISLFGSHVLTNESLGLLP
jgi:hypothetical protein